MGVCAIRAVAENEARHDGAKNRLGWEGEARVLPLPRRRKSNVLDPDADQLLELVASEHKLPVQMLLHASRCRADIAAVRQLAMYLTHVLLGRTFTQVGASFGRDRTTVSHACALIEDKRDDPRFDAAVCRLEKMAALAGLGFDAAQPDIQSTESVTDESIAPEAVHGAR